MMGAHFSHRTTFAIQFNILTMCIFKYKSLTEKEKKRKKNRQMTILSEKRTANDIGREDKKRKREREAERKISRERRNISIDTMKIKKE